MRSNPNIIIETGTVIIPVIILNASR